MTLKHWIALITVCIAISYVAQNRFYTAHNHLPTGCDEFGYLQLAETFNGQPSPAVRDSLGAHLHALEIPYQDYAWLITPHAYHYAVAAQSAVNQYPPATSALLALFPKESRQTSFPGWIAITLFLGVFLALRATKITPSIAIALAGIVATSALFLPPISIELGRINSLAPTFGLLLAAGICWKKHPYITIACIAATLPFRIANAVIIPVAIISLTHFNTWKGALKQLTLQGAIVSIGALIILGYQFFIFGDPLHPTYSSIDQATTVASFWKNLNFYAVQEPYWLFVHVAVSIALVVLHQFNAVSKNTILAFHALASLNYVFYLFHEVAIYYYPYASAVIGAGMAIYGLAKWVPVRITTHQGTFGILLIYAAGVFSQPTRTNTVSTAQQHYSACFSSNTVVWSELRSGTVQYAAGAIGMRYLWGSDQARLESVLWLQQRGLKQYIWHNEFSPEQVENIANWLAQNNIENRTVNCEELGTFFELR